VFGQALKRNARRKIRFNSFVERAQQKIRMNPRLSLPQIGTEIDVSESDILIDCGANVGDVSSSFARTGARIYAFEPSPLSFAILKKRFSRTPNVTLFNKGVMDRTCALQLSTPLSHGRFDSIDSTISASFINDSLPPSSTTIVDCVDLSAFIFSLLGRVRLLKLDIEGSEIRNCPGEC